MKYQLKIGWLYPELMSTYGDRGNILVLTMRCEWRGIEVAISNIDFGTKKSEIEKCDLVFGGGAQDRQQAILIDDLREKKGNVLKSMFDRGVPGLFVCGAPQLLGNSYMTGDGRALKGLGIFDMETKHFGFDKPRCIGNMVSKVTGIDISGGLLADSGRVAQTVVGFENHGGRTYLGPGVRTFAKIIKGFGNNGEDGTEGAVYNNCIATYSHGPFLPKNPHVGDWLISQALKVKYNQDVILEPLVDALEWQAHDFVVKRYG